MAVCKYWCTVKTHLMSSLPYATTLLRCFLPYIDNLPRVTDSSFGFGNKTEGQANQTLITQFACPLFVYSVGTT